MKRLILFLMLAATSHAQNTIIAEWLYSGGVASVPFGFAAADKMHFGSTEFGMTNRGIVTAYGGFQVNQIVPTVGSTNCMISGNDLFDPKQGFGIAGWFKCTNLTYAGGFYDLVTWEGNAATNRSFAVGLYNFSASSNAASPFLAIYNYTNVNNSMITYSDKVPFSVALNSWFFMVAGIDSGTNMMMQVNGVDLPTSCFSNANYTAGKVAASTAGISIGTRQQNATSYSMPGFYYDIRIISGLPTSAFASQLYADGIAKGVPNL